MKVRSVVVVAIAAACGACKPGGPDDPVGYGGATSVTPGHGRGAPAKASAIDALAGKHRAPVEIVTTVPVPGGSAVAYAYGRLQSRIGEETATGRDVTAELEEAERHCEKVRAALDPGEREWIEAEYLSCEAVAATEVFKDDQLVPDCRALGVAYFDPDGILLSNVEVGGPCLSELSQLEAYDLTPEPDDELMLTARFSTFGELTRGGWGTTQQETRMVVLALRPGEIREDLDVELDVDLDGGNCGHGIDRSVRIPQVGLIEVYTQEWNDCDQEGCMSPEELEAARQELEDDEVLPEYALCETRPVKAERARWVPEEQSWTVLEGFEFEGSALPDGIRG
jgi:hypothetical protein